MPPYETPRIGSGASSSASAAGASVSCSPTFAAVTTAKWPVDVDGVRRHDHRDVGRGRRAAPPELLHRRAQRGVEVDVAVRRDAREDEAHGKRRDPRDEQLEEPLGVDVDPDVGVLLARR